MLTVMSWLRSIGAARFLLAALLVMAGALASASAAPRAAPPCHERAADMAGTHHPARPESGAALQLCCALHCAATPRLASAPARAAARPAAPLWRLADAAPPVAARERIERPPRRA
ncbi:MAG: hypothetical protein JNK46_12270 [Methylobacteriaceae bacterium]|nr:hypothetical protein [Methylobacteriaceae bacterium]